MSTALFVKLNGAGLRPMSNGAVVNNHYGAGLHQPMSKTAPETHNTGAGFHRPMYQGICENRGDAHGVCVRIEPARALPKGAARVDPARALPRGAATILMRGVREH